MNDLVGPPVFNLEPSRQWWGVYSVRAHMDMRALARELLLYDRLVLPVPEDIDEADRWDDRCGKPANSITLPNTWASQQGKSAGRP